MNALASVRGQEAAVFKAIGPFVASDADRTAAIAALLRIPTTYWPAEEANRWWIRFWLTSASCRRWSALRRRAS